MFYLLRVVPMRAPHMTFSQQTTRIMEWEWIILMYTAQPFHPCIHRSTQYLTPELNPEAFPCEGVLEGVTPCGYSGRDPKKIRREGDDTPACSQSHTRLLKGMAVVGFEVDQVRRTPQGFYYLFVAPPVPLFPVQKLPLV